MDAIVDLAIIGGGINGCGIARDAAGRGLSVYLCEMNDLASGTSSWSTKLIHGGLRYLEHYEFRLVREALMEREVLWAIAPHLIHPMRFVLPHRQDLRPAWLVRLGLFFYDTIGGRRKLPGTKVLDLTRDAAGVPLKSHDHRKAFEYSDCTVDDARLVVANAMDARARGAHIQTRTKAVAARRVGQLWELTVEDRDTRHRTTIKARALINAAGPWVGDVLGQRLGVNAKAKVRLVQGSHIVVRKLYDHDKAYMLQNKDGRIVFAIPYQDDFTLIGTTDRDYTGDPADVHATAEEIAYLCEMASAEFARPVQPADVVWSYSGVRPLYDDGASEAKAATRDYVFENDGPADGGAPLLSIFGGKITTYRRLSEEALAHLAKALPDLKLLSAKAGWTAKAPLPGGDFPAAGDADVVARTRATYPFLTPQHASRLVAAYGTLAVKVLGSARSATDLGVAFGATLTEAEVRYLMRKEWAMSAEDVVWRRSKLGLRMTLDEVAALNTWMENARLSHPVAANAAPRTLIQS